LSCINYNKYKCNGKVVLKGNSCELTTGHTCDNYVKNKQGKIIKGKNNIYFKNFCLKKILLKIFLIFEKLLYLKEIEEEPKI